MHGRLKVRTTAEQQAAKAKERAAKVEKLTKAKQFIFSTMSSIDACSAPVRLQLNRVTAEVLSHIPEFHTVWNVRKRILLKTKAEIFAKLAPAAGTTTPEVAPAVAQENSEGAANEVASSEKQSTTSEAELWNDLATVLGNELAFIVECIRHQPKAYPIWYHRIWLYSRFLDAAESTRLASHVRAHLEEDLRLTELLLSQDERNFHCWEFRRFVLARLERPAKQELEFLHERIANNFSNYSAWHQRCMLLFEDGVPIDLTAFLTVFNDEFELLENAFYTDPADQSSWCYYRWLLAKALEHAAAPHSALRNAYVRRESDTLAELVLVLDEPLARDELRQLLDRPGLPPLSSFRPAHTSDETVSSVWFAPVQSQFNLAEAFNDASIVLPDVALFPHTDDAADVSEQNRAALRSVLSRHAESFVALAQLDSENPTGNPESAAAATRNCMLTHTALLEQLDPHVHAETVRHNYAELARLDPARHRVYETMRARFEVRLRRDDSRAAHTRTLDLSGVQLAILPDCRPFAFVTSLSLRTNRLTGPFDPRNFSALRALVHLDLSANRISDLTGLDALSSLRVLNLDDNLIAEASQLAPLFSITLQQLHLARNPLALRFVQSNELEEPASSFVQKVAVLHWQ